MAKRMVTFIEKRRRFNSDMPLALADNEQIVGVTPYFEPGDGSRGVDVFIAVTSIDGSSGDTDGA